jgi:hypothetical protein
MEVNMTLVCAYYNQYVPIVIAIGLAPMAA